MATAKSNNVGPMIVELLEVGDVVRLRSGGAPATVTAASGNGDEVDLLAWSDTMGWCETSNVPALSLVLEARGPVRRSDR